MGSFEVYCAICGASLRHREVGSADEQHLKCRQYRIEKILEEIQAEDDVPKTWTPEAAEEMFIKLDYPQDDVLTYDPRIVSEESLDWLENSVLCLGFDPDSAETHQAFIAPGRYDDLEAIYLRKGNDPSQPEGGVQYFCYSDIDDEWPVFPFHSCCFKLLSKVLAGSGGTYPIDKEALYGTMNQLKDYDYARALAIDYGDISGMCQDWECVPGEEFCVTHPIDVDTATISDYLQRRFADEDFKSKSNELDLQNKVKNDAFATLPYDILYLLFRYLPADSFLNLILASWHVNYATRNRGAFWKHHMRVAMPWFWELDEFLEQPLQDIDYKQVYFWLEKETTPRFAMEGPLLGIANRRRIWYACEQIAVVYWMDLSQDPSTTDNEASAVNLDDCRCLEMSLVCYPQPSAETAKTVCTQWIRSWAEAKKQPCLFETFWRGHGEALMGLSLTVEGEMRIFGTAEDADTTMSEAIKPGEKIESLTFHMTPIDLRRTSGVETAICGVEVHRRTRKPCPVLGNASDLRKTIRVNPVGRLAGITGQIAENGTISRIGLLEYFAGDYDAARYDRSRHDAVSSNSQEGLGDACLGKQQSQDSLDANSTLLPDVEVPPPKDRPPLLGQYIMKLPNLVGKYYDDVLEFAPCSSFIWADITKAGEELARISASIFRSSETASAKYDWPGKKSIVGFRAEYISGSQWTRHVETGYVGQSSAKATQNAVVTSPKGSMQHFDIDGANGEYVTEVGVGLGDTLSLSLSLRTNKGRQVVFGEECDASRWYWQAVEKHSSMRGLYLNWGSRVGFNEETGHYDHLGVSSVMAVALPDRP